MLCYHLHNLLLLLFFVTLSWLWVGLSQDMSNVTSFVNCPANPLRVCVICFAICIAFVSLWTFIKSIPFGIIVKIFCKLHLFYFFKVQVVTKMIYSINSRSLIFDHFKLCKNDLLYSVLLGWNKAYTPAKFWCFFLLALMKVLNETIFAISIYFRLYLHWNLQRSISHEYTWVIHASWAQI